MRSWPRGWRRLRAACVPLFVLVFVHTAVVPVFAQTCGNGVREGDEECDDGNTVGGDGCAANCTHEDRRVCQLGPGSHVVPTFSIGAVIGTIPLSGRQTLTTGHARSGDPSGQIPIVVKAADIQFAPIRGGIFCFCIRAVPIASAGSDTVATGTLSCAAGGLPQVDYSATRDHNTHLDVPDPDPGCSAGMVEDGSPTHPHAGACNGPQHVMYTAGEPAGAAVMSYNLVLYTILDSCVSMGPGAATRPQGADGIPCTADDPMQPAASLLLATTGTATAKILHANNDMAATFQVPVLTGHALNCTGLAADPTGGLEGVAVVGGLFTLDAPGLGDEIDAYTFACEAPTAARPTPSFTPSPTALGTATRTPTVSATPTLSASPTQTATSSATATPSVGASATQTQAPTGTPTATPTVPLTSTNSPTASPTLTPTSIPCVGDCDSSGDVTVNELITMVNIALGTTPLSACTAGDADHSGDITINEIIAAVTNALTSCTGH